LQACGNRRIFDENHVLDLKSGLFGDCKKPNLRKAMHKFMRCVFAAILIALLGAATGGQVEAQNYPTRPVRIVVPYPAGGPTDAIARIIAQKLSEKNGVQFYVENIAGAGATIGIGHVANAQPDGYTMLITTQDIIVQAVLRAKIPYDPFKSFAPIALAVKGPELIVVHPSVPAKDMKELMALLKANPGKFNYATPGFGTTPHLVNEHLFKITHGLDVTHVPFQGGAPAVQATLAGHTQIFMNVVPTVAPHVRQGTLRAVGVASKERSRFFPDVPTLEEAGFPKHESEYWVAALFPAGTSKDKIDLLQGQIAELLKMPDVQERLNVLGFDGAPSTTDALAAYLKAEFDKWGSVVRASNIKIE
jgi:tripartite-type tricarboxylate transporter receptor subunit TctC